MRQFLAAICVVAWVVVSSLIAAEPATISLAAPQPRQVVQRTGFDKHDFDLTGNGLNHPNDFGHRLYAQAILSLLAPPPPK